MKFNNSIKLAMANFALFWKLLLYVIIAFAVCSLFVLPISGVLGECFGASGFFDAFVDLFSMPLFQGVETLLQMLMNLLSTFFVGLQIMIHANLFVFVYFLIVLLIIVPFIFKLADVPATESAYSYMSSLNKNSFSINFVNLLGKSAGYAILRSLMEVPFWLGLVGGAYGILSLSQHGGIWIAIVPLLLFVFIVLIFDLNLTSTR